MLFIDDVLLFVLLFGVYFLEMHPVVACILFDDGIIFDEAFEGLFLLCFDDIIIFEEPFDGLFLYFE